MCVKRFGPAKELLTRVSLRTMLYNSRSRGPEDNQAERNGPRLSFRNDERIGDAKMMIARVKQQSGQTGSGGSAAPMPRKPFGACRSCDQRAARGAAEHENSEPGQELTLPQAAAPDSETGQAEPDTRSKAAPQAAVPSQAPDPAAPVSGGLIVDDAAEIASPAQMKKSVFLRELESSIRSAADQSLASTGKTTEDCPYIATWFGFYRMQDAARINRAIAKYAPESTGAQTADDLISVITERARLAVERWAATGQITGVPPDVSLTTPGDSVGGGSSAQKAGGAARPSTPLLKERDGGGKEASDPQAIRGRLSHGSPLDGSALARMQGAFGHDFSQVRVHTDSSAAQAASSLNARAFTVGSDIAFGSGEYAPGTAIGDARLAYELAHVVQQSDGRASTEGSASAAPDSQAIEEDADSSAVGAVASLWGGAKAGFAEIAKNASPRLRSGLRLSRCGKPCTPTFKSLTATSSGLIVVGSLSDNPGCDIEF